MLEESVTDKYNLALLRNQIEMMRLEQDKLEIELELMVLQAEQIEKNLKLNKKEN